MTQDATNGGAVPSGTKTDKRASEIVASQLAQKILTGELQDGQPLPPERNLMQQFGISRAMVREAVVALSNRGLVDARPRYRPIVRRPGYDAAVAALETIVAHLLYQKGGVKNLFDTRIMVEASLVRHAAIYAQKDHIAALKAALSENMAAIDDSDLFYRTDKAFHGVFYTIPGNPVLPAIHKAYTTWLEPHWSQMPRSPKKNQGNFSAHERIFDAILLRDPDAAEHALREHLHQAWEQVRRTFGDL
ncbi:MAG: FCD domain-containing protein [Pseudorhodobacter sp.]